MVCARSGGGGKWPDLSSTGKQYRWDPGQPFPPPWGEPWWWEVLTADLGAQLVLPDGMQLLVLLLRKLQALLLHLVDLLLRTQCLLGHHQVILQHVLLLPPPLHPGVLDLSGFWNRPQRL